MWESIEAILCQWSHIFDGFVRVTFIHDSWHIKQAGIIFFAFLVSFLTAMLLFTQEKSIIYSIRNELMSKSFPSGFIFLVFLY